MRTLVPMIYKDFRCIGSACRDNCCIGWEIDIDGRTADFYRSVSGPFGDRLRENIDWEEQCFRLGEGERCPFLNKQNLCDIIIGLGEEHLCEICDRHPRFRNIFPDRVEMGIGLCCEEAVRLLLECEEKMALVPGPDVDEEPADPGCRAAIGSVRRTAFQYLQDRERPLTDRIRILLGLADELYLEQDEYGIGQKEVCSRFSDEKYAAAYAENGADVLPENAEEQLWQQIAEVYLPLERLDESWTALIEGLPGQTEKKELPETPFEQLIWYFLFRHLPAAAEDGDTAGRILFALVSYLVIRRMVQQGGDLYDIARRYSKEIEYSTENVDALLDAFAQEECFDPGELGALL